LFSVTDLML
jgi:hypothetical protein